mmetsp:Transcript_858/g.2239  ORF Transcript_858/g.2239 Transcript_858/m.2239 type:complete len:128 (-) Transcript_858:246-629(-)
MKSLAGAYSLRRMLRATFLNRALKNPVLTSRSPVPQSPNANDVKPTRSHQSLPGQMASRDSLNVDGCDAIGGLEADLMYFLCNPLLQHILDRACILYSMFLHCQKLHVPLSPLDLGKVVQLSTEISV